MFISPKTICSLLLISLSTLLSSTASLVKKQATLTHALVQHITDARKADTYWACIQYAPVKNFLPNLFMFGRSKSWKDEILKKRHQLQKTIIESAYILGELEASPRSVDPALLQKGSDIIAREKIILTHNTAPSHIARQWPLYALAGISTYTLYYFLHKKISVDDVKRTGKSTYTKHVKKHLDTIKKYQQEAAAAEEHIASNTTNYQQRVDQIISEINKNPELKKMVEKDGLTFASMAQGTLDDQQKKIDRLHHLVMTQLVEKSKTDIQKNRALANIPSSLNGSKDSPSSFDTQAIISSLHESLDGIKQGLADIADSNIDTDIRNVQRKIEALPHTPIPDWMDNTLNVGIDKILKHTPVGSITDDIANISHNGKALSEKMLDLAPKIETIVNNAEVISQKTKELLEKGATEYETFKQDYQTIRQDYDMIKNDYETIKGDYFTVKEQLGSYEPYIKLLVATTDLKVKFFEIILLQVTRKTQLPLVMLGAIPAAFICYATYKGGVSIWHAFTDMHFIEPLRKDLIQLQLHLNRHRHVAPERLNHFYKGMSYYWITQLEKYARRLPVEYRTSYKEYLEELRSCDYSPEQKMMIIEYMFKDYGFLK